MSNATDVRSAKATEDSNRFWYSVLNMFPFAFLPIVILIAILSSWVMPYLTSAHSQ